MGLDIAAYEKLELVNEASTDGDANDLVSVYAHPHFPAQADGMDGVYRASGQRHEFRAGSYSGYNWWREQLAAMMGTTPEQIWDGGSAPAFASLINFADNEGAIGPKTSAQLAKDFADWRERAALHAKKLEPQAAEGFVALYADWEKPFTIAARGGAVIFR